MGPSQCSNRPGCCNRKRNHSSFCEYKSDHPDHNFVCRVQSSLQFPYLSSCLFLPHYQSLHPALTHPITMSSCDCDRKTSNGGNCDSSCKECEPIFVFETVSSPKMFYAPVIVATKVSEVQTVEAFSTDRNQ